tara:strand:- start:1 stop:576 length:576 start_codon:yes stop_codon:yes gene_type:complete
MTTSKALTVIPAINTLESEGSALAEMYKKEQTSLKKKFTQSIKMDQLSYRLGKLLNTLSAEAEGGRIKSKRLAEVGIANIDKRRRAEALWFYQNYKKATAFIKASKKGFTSLTALQLAMKKADKSNDGPSTEGDTEGNTEGKPSTVNAESIVANVLATAEKHNIDIQQVVLMLIDSATATADVPSEERKAA